jgi:hypothetical protein
MSLIDRIDSRILLQGGSATSAGGGGSTIGGQGTSSSFDGGAVIVDSLGRIGDAFNDSFLRISTAVSAVQKTEDFLRDIQSVATQLVDLAQRAVDPQASTEERRSLNSTFQRKIQDFENILDEADVGDEDFLDMDSIEKVLQAAGINTSSSNKVTESLKSVGGSDGQLGYEPIRSEEVFVNPRDTSESGFGEATSSNPLNRNLSTLANATIALSTFQELKEDIRADLKGISGALDALQIANKIALEGRNAADGFASRVSSTGDAQSVATALQNSIRSAGGGSLINSHSDLDRILVSDILSIAS